MIAAEKLESSPDFVFGLLADAQYGDKDDGFGEGRNQRYREVPGKLKAAVESFVIDKPAFVLTLGDAIDGRETQEETTADLETVASVLDTLAPSTPVYNVVGNHDLSAPRAQFVARMKLPSSYYSVTPAPGWRLLVLDTTDLSQSLGHSPDSPQVAEANAFVAAHPLGVDYPHVEDWNGGVAAEQMRWLDQELATAQSSKERVIVASHHPIGAGCCRPTHHAWNWPILQQRFVDSGVVVLCLAGHDHPGGYSCVEQVHFVTVEAMLEAPAGSNAYALVHVYRNHISIKGVGTVTSRTLALRDRE